MCEFFEVFGVVLVVELAGLEEAHERGEGLGSAFGLASERVFSDDDTGSDHPFSEIVMGDHSFSFAEREQFRAVTHQSLE